MSLIAHSQKTLLAQRFLFINQKRFSVRESIHRHVEPDKFKKHMLAACEPYFKRKYQLPEETCGGVAVNQHELHPLEKIMVNELLESINNSNFILFIQYNYTKFVSERVYKNTLIKSGGTFHALNNRIYKETFRILKQEQLNHLFVTRNALLTGDAKDLPNCLIALRKMPKFLLLAGTIDKQLYNVDQLRQISLTNNIDQCRAALIGVLENPAIELSSKLNQYNEINQTTEQPSN